MIVITLRKLLLSLIIVFLNDYPRIDIFLLITVNIISIYLNWKIKPYKNAAFTFRDIICELCFIGIHFSSLFLF